MKRDDGNDGDNQNPGCFGLAAGCDCDDDDDNGKKHPRVDHFNDWNDDDDDNNSDEYEHRGW